MLEMHIGGKAYMRRYVAVACEELNLHLAVMLRRKHVLYDKSDYIDVGGGLMVGSARQTPQLDVCSCNFIC